MAEQRRADTMADWMRDIMRRLRHVERHRHPPPSTVRPPGWTITVDDAGNLVARPDSGDPDVVIAPAP